MKRLTHPDLKKPQYRAWIDFLKKSERWNASRIRKYQLKELKRVVSHAYENSAGYRALFDKAGIKPNMIKSLDDIRRLPFVSKEILRDNVDLYRTPSKNADYVTTGGSTGIPFGFYRDKGAFAKELASKAFQYYRMGWKEGCRQMLLRGLTIPSKSHMRLYPAFGELRCSSYHLTPDSMEAYRKRAWKYKPDFLKCYPSSGYIFAQFLKENGKTFPPIKGVLCASENLYDFQKKAMVDAFKCRIFSHYGHYEMAVLAGFCEHKDTLHVLPQYGYAELLDKKGNPVTKPGEIGEIVGTSFINNATPFIRYKTRDMAVFKSFGCPSCGRPYQIWERVEGRLQEFIVTSTERLISMTAVNMHDDIFDTIKQFQFFQEKKGHVIFNFIPKESFKDGDRESIRKRLQAKLGDDITITMRQVNDIPPTKRGKHRFLIQKLDLKYGNE